MSAFTYPLFGCFDDPKLCIITLLLPCYTIGQTAEKVGESCVGCAVAYMFLGCFAGGYVRGKVRQQKDIEGTPLTDLLNACLCPWCALIQDHREVIPCGNSYEQAMART